MAGKQSYIYTLTVLDSTKVEISGCAEENQRVLTEVEIHLRRKTSMVVELLQLSFQNHQWKHFCLQVSKSDMNRIELALPHYIHGIHDIVKAVMEHAHIAPDHLDISNLEPQSVPAKKLPEMKMTEDKTERKEDTSNEEQNGRKRGGTRPSKKYLDVYTGKFPTSGRVIRKIIQDVDK